MLILPQNLKQLRSKTHQHVCTRCRRIALPHRLPAAPQQSKSSHSGRWGLSSSPGSRTRPASSHWRCLFWSAPSELGHTSTALWSCLPFYLPLEWVKCIKLEQSAGPSVKLWVLRYVYLNHLCECLTWSPLSGQVRRHKAPVLSEISGYENADKA